MSKAADDVLAERARQMSMEGWTAEHDDTHDAGEMACAPPATPSIRLPHSWGALRRRATGPGTCGGGSPRTGVPIW